MEKKIKNENTNTTIQTLITPKPISQNLVLTLLLLHFIPISNCTPPKPPPLPILPVPSSAQIQWQLASMALFLHFGQNTFTDTEWGTGRVSPKVFNPDRLNASQWVQVAKNAGFNRVVLTAKHHDGFCLWPSEYTDYSVKFSEWRNGTGDVVAELALAAEEAGVALGLYLSPWDRHEPCYGKTLEYNEFYMAQMTELLTRYGEIQEVFLDGAKGEGEKDMEYFFDSWFSLIHQLQPGAVIFSDAGPDIRWIGDEAGFASSTCWSLFNQSDVEIGGNQTRYAQGGDPQGRDWVPAECDVSIRPGWFWHAAEAPKSALTLLDIYYKSVGRNCPLLLNVPPNSSGLISAEDIQILQEFSELRRSIFSRNLAENSLVAASSTRGGISYSRFDPCNVLKEGIYAYWAPEENQYEWALLINLPELVSFNVLQVQEPIHMGQRIIEFHLDILNEEGRWQKLIDGTTVGYNRLLQFPTVKSQKLRFVIDKSRADPLIAYLGLYMDKFSTMSSTSNTSSHAYLNGSHILQKSMYNSSEIATM